MKKLKTGTHFTAEQAQVYINDYSAETGEYHVVRGIQLGTPNHDHAWLTRQEIDERFGPLTHINELNQS